MNEKTLLTLSELAKRWAMSVETVRKLACNGTITPAFGTGRGQRFSLADVQAAERAGSMDADVTLSPLSTDGRGNPKVLWGRVVVARDASEKAVQIDEAVNLDGVLDVAGALLAMVRGGGAAVASVQPVVGSRGGYGVRLEDPQAPQDLARLAHAALASLTLAECCAALSDLGPRMRKKFEEELTAITRLAGRSKA